MRLNFVKLDPNGNITLLVTSSIPRTQQPELATRILCGEFRRAWDGDGEVDLRYVEQVGFVESAILPGARARLQMMGGEFCGNASMSLAALLALEDGLDVGSGMEVSLEVSGTAELVRCRVERLDARNFLGSAAMPLPEGLGECALPDGSRVPLVRFPGIAHLIVPEERLSKADAEALIPRLCAQLNVEALGILLSDAEQGSMRPLVYVRSTDSAVWERGCGSGTAAMGAWAAARAGKHISLSIRQPGGTIGVRANCRNGAIHALEIQGSVRICAQGEIEV